MMNILFIYPNSLFEDNNLLKSIKFNNIYLLEDPIYFIQYNYHKMKLVLHRASMKCYKDYAEKKYNCKITYIDHNYNFNELYKSCKNKTIHMYDPIEHMIDTKALEKKYKFNIIMHDTPLFLNSKKDLENYMSNKDKKIVHADFYKKRQVLHNILLVKGKPIKSTDSDNRKPFLKSMKDIKIKSTKSKYIDDAIKYVNKYFKNNPGSPNLYLPIDIKGAKKQFHDFVKTKLENFGPYEDAVSKDIQFGYHSVLSPLMNIGLITPKYVIDEIRKIKITKKNLSSIEGYVRQVIGWREYCRLMYVYKREELEGPNYFGHTHPLNKKWYSDYDTGFDFINDMIKKTVSYGYLHHIERLMYIGNYMLLNKIKPKDVFTWFQSMFLDSYHVFMYPNVYGMSQHSAGPIMMTRPYFSSSSYINRMSDYKKGSSTIVLNDVTMNWDEVWDSLYYNFIDDNKEEFKNNYAIAMQVKNWKNISNKKEVLEICEEYFKKYL